VKRRNPDLIDAVEAIPYVSLEGTAWRIVREHRDPCQCSSSGGRWDDGTFDVLYTSLERDGAIAEMNFHLSKGQPVFPSRVRYELHELKFQLNKALRFESLADLEKLGVKISQFGKLQYADREAEYPTLQELAEVAHFLERDGIIVPNARWNCLNAILFGTYVPRSGREQIRAHGLVDWVSWRAKHVT